MSNYVRPGLVVAFILACVLWYVTADAGEFNSGTLFRAPQPREPAPLPEPASLAILGTGAVAALLARRRRK